MTIETRITIEAQTHFPTFCAIKTRYLMLIDSKIYHAAFWQFFIDGYESKHAIILN